jgi:cyanophycinase
MAKARQRANKEVGEPPHGFTINRTGSVSTKRASKKGKVIERGVPSGYRKGSLIIIGGHEDKEHEMTILREVAKPLSNSRKRLLIVTVASHLPKELAEDYTEVFSRLGVKNIDVLDIRTREDAYSADNIDKIKDASVVFFTGGDQLRITSQIGGSPVSLKIRELFKDGGTVAGTSAGAAAMPDTMLFSGPSDESHEISALGMAPGLGLIEGVVIDSHFAERGRMGRLLGAVAQNPRNLGIGIDEDTAIAVRSGESFEVIGRGAVYIVDGTRISYTGLSERHAEGTLSIYDVKLHVLTHGDCYDLITLKPTRSPEGIKEIGT